MSREIIQNVAYDNYDDFQHANFIFSQNFISLYWGLVNDEIDLRVRNYFLLQVPHSLPNGFEIPLYFHNIWRFLDLIMELIIGMLPIRSNMEVKPSKIYKWIELVTWGERCIYKSMTPIDN